MHVDSNIGMTYYKCPECDKVSCLLNSKLVKKEGGYVVICPNCKKEIDILVK